jgi:hypothetical protein
MSISGFLMRVCHRQLESLRPLTIGDALCPLAGHVLPDALAK